jgi:tungstate transport system ATP-binding protein
LSASPRREVHADPSQPRAAPSSSSGDRTALLPLALDRVRFDAGGRRILDDISLTIGAGGKTIILGANGAGKSVLMRICHGLLAPTAGTVRWRGGVDGRDPRARARQAMVFQKPVMLRRSARDNVIYALRRAGHDGRASARIALDALERVRLAEIAEQPARSLSGGEQQRLARARAWALAPEVLFLDEPTASLDPQAAEAIEALIRAIADGGAKIIMTTHHLALAARLADEIVFLSRGRVLEQTAAAQFFRAPRSEEARAFIRSETAAG